MRKYQTKAEATELQQTNKLLTKNQLIPYHDYSYPKILKACRS